MKWNQLMKRFATAGLVAAMTVSMAACGGTSKSSSTSNQSKSASSKSSEIQTKAVSKSAESKTNTAPAESADASRPDLKGKDLSKIKIGMAYRNGSNDTYMTSYFQHIKNYAKKQGVDLVLLDAVDDVTKQTNQVQDLIQQKCDVIMIWPVNSESSVAQAKSVQDAGIPCLMCNSNVTEDGVKYTTGFVGPDDFTEGYNTGKQAMKDLGDQAKGAKILFVEGVAGQQQAQDRKNGMIKAVEEAGGEMIDSQSSEGKREKAQQVTENWLVKYPGKDDFTAIFTFDDNTAVGVYNAAKASGREGEFPIWAAATGDYSVISGYIKDGKISGASLQSPITESESALDWACAIATGDKLPSERVFISTPVITKENFKEVDQGNFEDLI
jgi:ribose transport system substrate-binding protein